MKKLFFLLPAFSLYFLSYTPNSYDIEEQPHASGGLAAVYGQNRTGSPNSSGQCSNCHAGGSFSTVMSVVVRDSNNVSVTSYKPNEDYTIIFTVNNLAGSPAGFGFQGAIMSPNSPYPQAGAFNSVNTLNTQITNLNGYTIAEHNGISPLDAFSVNWTAPAPGFGNVTVYTSGICVNANGSTSGDQGATAFLSLTEQCVTSFATDVQSACGSFTWIDGNTYNTNNNSATATLTNAGGCDSIVTLDLTINSPSAGTDVQTACDSYTWIDGNTYTASNNAASVTLTNAAGCDSVVTLDLTINNVSDNTVAQNGATLTANNANATYQWIDCDNGNAAISGATTQVYTATANGNYAVVLTENGCTDTSACVNVVLSSTHFLGNERIQVYPNPTTDNINIDFSSPQDDIQLRIYDVLGQLVIDKRYTQRDLIQVALPQLTGLYLLELQTDKGSTAFRVVKE